MKQNPFSDPGVLAAGSRFVGRSAALATIKQRVLETEYPGALALVGQRRIGKSSLAHQCLVYPKEPLRQRRIAVIWLPFAELCTSPQAFFLALIRLFDDEFEAMGISDRRLSRHAETARRSQGEWLDLSLAVHDYFRQIRALGWLAVPVVDEFDKARTVFQEFPQAFQAMRELASQPDRRVAFVTTSRRELYDIEQKVDPESSIFSGVFEKEHVSCFNSNELRLLLARLEAVGITPNEEIVTFFETNTGGHPFLASLLGFRVAEGQLVGHPMDLEFALRGSLANFLEHYSELVNLLKKDEILEPLLKILFGPTAADSLTRAKTLQTYGLIRPGADMYYRAFSDHFTDYLRIEERSTELWPLWSETERALRGVIDEVFAVIFKSRDWSGPLVKVKPRFSAIISGWIDLRERERRAAGQYASERLLDFSHPNELFQLIDAYWASFHPIFGKTQAHWRAAGDILAAIRTPLAHNRPTSIDDGAWRQAEGYCISIRAAVARWNQRTAASKL